MIDQSTAPTAKRTIESAVDQCVSRRGQRRRLLTRWLAAGAGVVTLSTLSHSPAQAANGDAVLAGQTVDATTPTRVRNGVTYAVDSTADGIQGYATGANNAGLFGRNNATDGIGVSGAAPNGTGIFGESLNGFGVGGRSSSGIGVQGTSTSGYGGSFAGGLTAIRLTPAATGTGAPTSGAHQVGELYADSAGALFYCTVAGTPGTWLPVLLGSGGGSGTGSGYMAAITPPPSAGWSWVNQGSATVTTVENAECLATPASSGDNIRARTRPIPSAPYYVTALFVPNFFPINFLHAGLTLRESSSGKLRNFGFGYANGGMLLLNQYTGPTSFSSTPFNTSGGYWTPGATWLRIGDDNAGNFKFWYSLDGRVWTLLYTTTPTTFCTPDEVGIFVNGLHGAAAISLVSWKVETSFGGMADAAARTSAAPSRMAEPAATSTPAGTVTPTPGATTPISGATATPTATAPAGSTFTPTPTPTRTPGASPIPATSPTAGTMPVGPRTGSPHAD